LSTANKWPDLRRLYVTRDACEGLHQEQREANRRTWEEIRTLRRLVITLVVGGQLFSGGLNLAGVGYWLEQHSAQPHAATVQMLAAARSEAREDLRDLRQEVHELAVALGRPDADRQRTKSKEGEAPCPLP